MAARRKRVKLDTPKIGGDSLPTAPEPKRGAPKGNRFWEMRSTHGRAPIFETPDALWDAATQYFAWVEDNPLYEDKLVTYLGSATHEPVAKMRAMTIGALCIFLGIDRKSWDNYCDRKDFFPVTSQVESIIRAQKFEGASADLLNANIIARDLGLADKQELTGKDGKPLVPVLNVSRG